MIATTREQALARSGREPYGDAGAEVVSVSVQPRLPGRKINRMDPVAVVASSTTTTLAHDAVRPVRSGPGSAAAAGSVQAEASR